MCIITLFLQTPVKKDAASWEKRMSRLNSLDDFLHVRYLRHKDTHNKHLTFQTRLTKPCRHFFKIFQIWPIRSKYFEDVFAELNDLIVFVDMVKAMLHLEAAYRITPRQVLSHPFTSMSFFHNSASSI